MGVGILGSGGRFSILFHQGVEFVMEGHILVDPDSHHFISFVGFCHYADAMVISGNNCSGCVRGIL